jgi:hypothetical protein
MSKHKESTIYKKARNIGYSINKGKVHFLSAEYPVYCDDVGFNVIDNQTGFTIWGCYNNVLDHLWSLEDVETFLKEQYESLGMEY